MDFTPFPLLLNSPLSDALVARKIGTCDLRVPHGLTRSSEVHPGTITFPPVYALLVLTAPLHGPIRFPQRPFQCPRSRTATLEQVSYIEPSPRFNSKGVRPAGDPVDSDPGARIKTLIPTQDRAVARTGLECVTHPEPTVLSRVSWRPPHLNINRFHHLACYLGSFQDR